MSRKKPITSERALAAGFTRIGEVMPGVLTLAEARDIVMGWANDKGYMILPDSISVMAATPPDEGTFVGATVRKFEPPAPGAPEADG